MHNLATVASQGATFYFFTKVTLPDVSKNDVLTFFELIQSPVLLITFPVFRVGQINQMTLVFFPYSLHSLPFHGRVKMPAFRIF